MRAARNGREPQVLAANVDLVVVVASLTREFNLGRVERMLTLAADAPAEAVVVLSKADLDARPGRARGRGARARWAAPRPCCRSRPVDGSGLEAVAALLGPGVTGVLLGASGVGKTTLLNALAGGERATAPIRGADDRGRHTTTWRELVPLAGGGVIIDTPGPQAPAHLGAGERAVERVRRRRGARPRAAASPTAATPASPAARSPARSATAARPERLAALEQLGASRRGRTRAATRARGAGARRRRAASTASSGGSRARNRAAERTKVVSTRPRRVEVTFVRRSGGARARLRGTRRRSSAWLGHVAGAGEAELADEDEPGEHDPDRGQRAGGAEVEGGDLARGRRRVRDRREGRDEQAEARGPRRRGRTAPAGPELWATMTMSAAVSVTGSEKAASMHSSEPIRSARLSSPQDPTRRM